MPDGQSVRLHCFAHSAEGVSAFADWAADVAPGAELVPVPLPGGAQRRTEPRLTTAEALLVDVLPRFTDPQPGPYVLYGHGLGALAALAVTRVLQEAGLPGPALLAVGACPPPHEPSELPDARGVPDADLLQILGGKGAVPPTSDEGIFLRAMLPELRADLELAAALREAVRKPSPADPLTTPLLVVAAEDDVRAARLRADGWSQWTAGPTWLRTIPGGDCSPYDRRLSRLVGRACRVVGRLVREPLYVS
ncbi:thioesterase domain-containing protein [Streptomyces sp. NPDC006458]|uniref:thioesterase II family protein n=1 Tax=Streptomyces sp. NPDC006458 TaxID=3154302 RepID=UPI0033AC313D